MKKAFIKGVKAADSGLSMADCPYPFYDKRSNQWGRGFANAVIEEMVSGKKQNKPSRLQW